MARERRFNWNTGGYDYADNSPSTTLNADGSLTMGGKTFTPTPPEGADPLQFSRAGRILRTTLQANAAQRADERAAMNPDTFGVQLRELARARTMRMMRQTSGQSGSALGVV